MDRKVVQEKRMKGYFIQATKEILKSEGLRCISVRNIADRAGYSYATLYNYFRDVKDLVFECVKDFKDECSQYVCEETQDTARGKKMIRAIVKAYIKFFVQYSGIFELFFLEKMSDMGHQQDTSLMIYESLEQLCAGEWAFMLDEKTATADEISAMKESLRFNITGLMLFYLNRHTPASYQEFQTSVERQLDWILN